MIPVRRQLEPADFSRRVREPGTAFLRRASHPTTWKNREYWRHILPDLHGAYGGICAYSAHWIPLDTGTATVDHFIPRSVRPDLAYEWTNYRLSSLLMNARKGYHQDVLDPFELQPDWFVLDFPSLQIKPNPALPASDARRVMDTIERLKLNDETCVGSRYRYVRDFCDGLIDFAYLRRDAPFIAYELQRQGLQNRETIVAIMQP